MAKWFGVIGYAETVEASPGVWEEQIVERSYYGDVIRNTRRLQTTDQVNDNVDISNEISVVADPYAFKNFLSIRYVEWMDTKWKISNIEVQYPRLKLSIGGVYNGEQAGSSS